MIKLNLSVGYDIISNFGAVADKYNLYLGYVKTRGFVFIEEKNNTAYFNCIESDEEPTLNWSDEMQVIKKIKTHLTIILKKCGIEDIHEQDNLKLMAISYLMEKLHSKFESSDYIKAKDVNNKRIRDFVLNPVEQFNFYLNSPPLEYDDFINEKRNIRIDLETKLNEVITLFNENKGIYGNINANSEETAPLIDEKQFIKLINKKVSNALDNPLLNIKFGNGKQKLNAIESIDYLIEEFNIKGVYRNGIETIYYFNDKLNYFETLTEEILKNIIIKNLGIKLLKSDYSQFYKSFGTTDKEYSNILVFKNILYDMDYMEELNYPNCNYNRKDYLAPALIGYEDKNDKVHLLDYDFDFDYMSLYEVDRNPAQMTYVEKTLRKILIPKDNPNDLRMFHDYLERVGSCILGKNNYKVITLYYGDGNNGKGILKLLMELVFNRGAYPLTPKNFEDNFNLQGFSNRKVLLIDEIDKNDFKDLKPTLKRISSPEGRLEQRAMHKPDMIKLNNFPNLFIFANELINLKLDEYALFDRLDFLKLQNTFVTKSKLNKTDNSYLVDRKTEDNIKDDIKGLSWLITASIRAFQHLLNSNTEYTLRQTAEQTMDILIDTDYLTKFILLYTYDDDSLIRDEYTSADEIYQQFKQYMDIKGHKIVDTEITIKRKIGTTIKQVYNIKGSISDSDMYYKRDNRISTYRLRLKSFDKVNEEFKQVYEINEKFEGDLSVAFYSNASQTVYKKIQNGVNTIDLLNKDLPNQDNYKIVRELLNLTVIKKTKQKNIMDN